MSTSKLLQNKTAAITPGAGIESLAWIARPIPEPGPGEVRIRIQAVSLNYRDLLIAWNVYPLQRKGPLLPVSDGAGTVEATGPGVTSFRTGDRVTANFMRDWVSGPLRAPEKASSLGGEVDGMLAEYVVLPEHALLRIPDSLSFAEAATLPCAAVTAWNALAVTATLKPGDTVLVQGSGGVSVFALQIARQFGARVIATSSSDAKLERLRDLGAEFGINYKTTPNWADAVLDYTGGHGVDHVVEVGGSGTFQQSLRAARIGGTVSVIGILTGIQSEINLVPILFNQLRVNGVFVGSRQMFEDLLRAAPRPVIDRTFAFDDAQTAYRYLESGQHFGKVVLER